MDRYDRKEKRKMRIRNHIARDLASPKYRQKVKQDKRKKTKSDEEWKQDVNDYFENK